MGTELVLVVYRPNKMIIDSTYIFPLYTLAIEVCDVHQFFKYAMHLIFFFFLILNIGYFIRKKGRGNEDFFWSFIYKGFPLQ